MSYFIPLDDFSTISIIYDTFYEVNYLINITSEVFFFLTVTNRSIND